MLVASGKLNNSTIQYQGLSGRHVENENTRRIQSTGAIENVTLPQVKTNVS
jgi:hypothetical protein